ncbi:5-bromo-4-chloroindolyl phosphate hydrolysis family protein [Pseudoruegeria sp. SHC-113]|uniref:5-bromo-4-chloroindolyl phosphate hydrolysis family protein n=1 Tax=Pseudoruegeria sp. SHC-113 TaxID=2855439 RepID=UPI0021BA8D77|nr:5-bromo-4-chloroindolyl phosphate hydrolysis family protein [Pseudoruegeria sp. SHC-113]MCT8159600.1 5-bromo-4-chloroindolyl phosphate hydrolysis family protein [Pseudoruegeria sp. SHC-113]
MAQKFGGKYSPGGATEHAAEAPRNPFEGKRRSRAGGRTNLLFFAPIPLAIRAFTMEPVGMAANLTAFGILVLAAWLTREGILAQEAYDARKVARKPAIPRKMFASALTGAGLALAGFAGSGSLLNALIFGVLGAGLHSFAFGLDPLTDKNVEGVDRHQSDRVARAVGEAEANLKRMSAAVARVNDRALTARVERFQASARRMFRTVEDDPRDLTAARKYLGIYLQGASDAAVKFADLYTTTRNSAAKGEFEALLDDLEANFDARTEALLLDNKADLDVEIDVLRERLQREGLARSQ